MLNCDKAPFGYKIGNGQLALMLWVDSRTIERVKIRFCEKGWKATLERKPSNCTYERMVEAHLVQLCCFGPSAGRARWLLRLLADKLVELH